MSKFTSISHWSSLVALRQIRNHDVLTVLLWECDVKYQHTKIKLNVLENIWKHIVNIGCLLPAAFRRSSGEEDGFGQAGDGYVRLQQRHEQTHGVSAFCALQRPLRPHVFSRQGSWTETCCFYVILRIYCDILWLILFLSSSRSRMVFCQTTPPHHHFCLPPAWSSPWPIVALPGRVWGMATRGWPCKTWTTDSR